MPCTDPVPPNTNQYLKEYILADICSTWCHINSHQGSSLTRATCHSLFVHLILLVIKLGTSARLESLPIHWFKGILDKSKDSLMGHKCIIMHTCLNLFLIWAASACCPHYRINLSSNYLTSLSSRLTKCTALLQSSDHEKWVLCGYNSRLINVCDESCSSLKIALHLVTFAKSWNWMRSGPWIFRLVLNFPQNSSSALEISICHGFHQSNSPPFYSQAKHFAMP